METQFYKNQNFNQQIFGEFSKKLEKLFESLATLFQKTTKNDNQKSIFQE